jgi:hypothetical protein
MNIVIRLVIILIAGALDQHDDLRLLNATTS